MIPNERIFSEQLNVFIRVSYFNPKPRKLYENLGSGVIGELKDYIAKGHSEILLRESISPLRKFHSRQK
jgi:hypothetical protein